MITPTHLERHVRFVVLFVAAILLPLSAGAQPVLSVSSTSVNAQANVGTNAPSQTVQVSNAGNRALKWSVEQASASWVTVSPTSGVNNGALTLTFRTSTLASGSYPTSFRVQSATGSAITINVNLSIVGQASLPAPPAPLTVTCPANKTVASSDGSPVVVTYAATTSGGVAPVTITGAPASGSSFPVGTTPVQVTAQSSDGQTARCGFSVTVTYSAPSSGDWTYCATEGNMCAFSGTKEVRYGASGSYVYKTLTDGTPCTNSVFGDPLSGATKQCHTGASSTAPPPSPSPSPTGVGPQSTITCPAGAVDIWPGVSIQNVVNSYGGNTTFCLRTGTHSLRSSITPKTGNTFVGEYGAVLDGTGWSTTDASQAAFRAHNQDIDYVTIRNLAIRSMPQRGIHAFYWMSDHWTIEYNEIAMSGNVGIVFAPDFLIRNNYIHHNTLGGYGGQNAHRATFESNEIAYNGGEQKVGAAANVTFRNNFVHHNTDGGIWYDSNNTGSLIEGNRVEDNGWMGIYYEISHDAIIRNNTVRRNGEAGIMLSVSKNVQIYGNTLEHNFRGITYFLNCGSVGGPTDFDLTNNTAHDNAITVGTQTGALATGFSYISSCTSTQVAPYLNGSKNLTFSRNTYRVPSISSRYWFWGPAGKTWIEWQGLAQDAGGTASQ